MGRDDAIDCKSAAVRTADRLLRSRLYRKLLARQSMRGCFNITRAVFASVLWVALSPGAFAAGVEPAKDLLIDPAPCLAAAAATDNDRIVNAFGPPIAPATPASPHHTK